MSKPDFNAVINELHTDLIVFVDDDFLPVKNTGEVLYHFLCLNRIDFELVLRKANNLDKELAEILKLLKEEFLKVDFSPADKEWFIAGELIKRLTATGRDEMAKLADAFIAQLKANEENITILAMNTGLAPASGAIIYQPFIDILNQYQPRKSVRIYRQLQGDTFNEFEDDLRYTLEQLPHKYFLFIVDKILGASDGRNLISELRERENGIDTFFSVLFTSQAEPAKNPDVNVQEFLHFEIQKPDPAQAGSAVELVAGGLAICAYATFFNRIFKLKMRALKNANELIVQSGKANMLYLAEMANAEGTTVFRTIDQWFDLLVQKKIYDSLVTPAGNSLDYQFITGLTSLINESYLPADDRVLDGAFRQELQELSNFELFNTAVNKLYYPPAPGDIYQLGDDIFILSGQDCDLIMREDGKSVSRKEKLAELVQCRFIPKPLDDKKFDTNLSLSLNYFYFDGQYGTLEIEFNKRYTIDFRIIDLCSLNPEGAANFQEASSLNNTARRSLPIMWHRYFPKLIEELTEKIKVQKFLAAENISQEILSADISYKLGFKEHEDTVEFPVKRLTRLKDQFKDYFLQRYWGHKTRKGLNNIQFYNRKPVNSIVCCGFHDALVEVATDHSAWVQLTGNREKNRKIEKLPLILHRTTLTAVIPSNFQDLFNLIAGDEIVLDKPEREEALIIIKKRWENGAPKVDICFPFYNGITGKHFKGKDEMSLAELLALTSGALEQGSQYHISGQDEMYDLFKGNKHKKIPLEHFELGIIVPATGWHIKLDRTSGILDYVHAKETIIDEQS